MRVSFSTVPVILLVALSANALAGDSVLDRLKIGVTTPQELENVFPGTRTEIPNGDGQTVVHFSDPNGSSGVCRFHRDRLFKYTVALGEESPDVTGAGGWSSMVEAGAAAFGPPKLKADDVVTWDLQEIYFSLSKRAPKSITVTLCNKRLQKAVKEEAKSFPAEPRVSKRIIYGGPYFFKGFRPDLTRKVKLTQGIYDLKLRHQGLGNFIVWMYSADDEDLVANEIGRSIERTVIRVDEPVREVFFAIERAGGPWEIDVRKVNVHP